MHGRGGTGRVGTPPCAAEASRPRGPDQNRDIRSSDIRLENGTGHPAAVSREPRAESRGRSPPRAALAQRAPRAAGRSPAESSPPGSLRSTIQSRLDSLHAQTAFFAQSLTSHDSVAVRADQPMNTVSVIKIPVMILAYRDADAGRLDLDQRYTIRPEDLRRGTGLLQTFTVGLQPTVRDLITQMIITSDNTATDIMIAKVGRERVNRMLDSLGYCQTRLRETIGDLFRATWIRTDPKYASLTDREVYDKGFPDAPDSMYLAFNADSAQWFGRTTAREMSHLLAQLQRGELASPQSTRAMLRTLREQLYASRLPQRIRFRAAIGHKTGDWPPIIGNDVGIIYAPSGPIVISVFTNQNTGSFFDLEATEGMVAQDVLDAWGPRK
ncbi:MAG TPA: serine hydrolase [Solirubrobacteraceae bacterium]|nr:serine hydrolase [Solirubrobacteraceae bacterium]